MKPLPLRQALELHRILSIHIPEEIGNDSLEFIGTIIKNIRESGKHRDYVEAISIMTGLEQDEIVQHSVEDGIVAFTEGLAINRILELDSFCNKLGVKHGSR